MKHKIAKWVFVSLTLMSTGAAMSGVPMDSFNSAHAGLVPSAAMSRQQLRAGGEVRGPLRALVEMARREQWDRAEAHAPPSVSDVGADAVAAPAPSL